MPAGELDEARELARLIGIRHEVVQTNELSDPNYVQNNPDRCYFCKTELYAQLKPVADGLGLATIANGANLDDTGDYRPGMTAAAENQIRSPLIECGLRKTDVRALAAEWNLPIWDKPASPCLSSRLAYGEQVTPERLAMIDRAEQYFAALACVQCASAITAATSRTWKSQVKRWRSSATPQPARPCPPN